MESVGNFLGNFFAHLVSEHTEKAHFKPFLTALNRFTEVPSTPAMF